MIASVGSGEGPAGLPEGDGVPPWSEVGADGLCGAADSGVRRRP
ncbi:hypothetical protein ACFQ0B_70905 [Nonomuraea thailandensis]